MNDRDAIAPARRNRSIATSLEHVAAETTMADSATEATPVNATNDGASLLRRPTLTAMCQVRTMVTLPLPQSIL